jgi:hypothetical protein
MSVLGIVTGAAISWRRPCVVISLGVFNLPDLPDYDWTVESSDLKGRLGGVHLQRFAWLTRCSSWIRAAMSAHTGEGRPRTFVTGL